MHLCLSEGGACEQELSKQIPPVSQHALQDKQLSASDCFYPYSPNNPWHLNSNLLAATPAAKVFGCHDLSSTAAALMSETQPPPPTPVQLVLLSSASST